MLADEHMQSRKALHRFDEAAGPLAGLTVPVAGFQMSACDVGVHSAPQAAGAQNEQVLRNLGYLKEDIARLKADGVI
jgi:crotonobetainyl-CoA:carnitine CoA-transferase CaiB-like acyl-CoA transferase